jgi:hypothetical protein
VKEVGFGEAQQAREATVHPTLSLGAPFFGVASWRFVDAQLAPTPAARRAREDVAGRGGAVRRVSGHERDAAGESAVHRSMHGVRRTSSGRRTAHAGRSAAFPGRLTAAPLVHRPMHALFDAFPALLTGPSARFTGFHAVHRAMHAGGTVASTGAACSQAVHRSMLDQSSPFSSLSTGRVAGRSAHANKEALSLACLSLHPPGDTVGALVDKRSRLARTVSLRAKAAGIAKRLGSLAKLTIGSVDYTPQQLVAILEDELDSIATVQQAESVRRAARLRERTTWKKNRRFHGALEGVVRAMFTNADELGDFGLKPAKKGKKTAQTKADAAEKAKATRATGKRAKKTAR